MSRKTKSVKVEEKTHDRFRRITRDLGRMMEPAATEAIRDWIAKVSWQAESVQPIGGRK